MIMLLPAQNCCLSLLDEFYAFDVLFRCVHRPSFDRSARRLLAVAPHLQQEDAPHLAAFVVAFHIGIGSSKSKMWYGSLTSIQQLQIRVFEYCYLHSMFSLPFSLAHALEIYRQLFASKSSPASAWIAVGKAKFCGALAGLHKHKFVDLLGSH